MSSKVDWLLVISHIIIIQYKWNHLLSISHLLVVSVVPEVLVLILDRCLLKITTFQLSILDTRWDNDNELCL